MWDLRSDWRNLWALAPKHERRNATPSSIVTEFAFVVLLASSVVTFWLLFLLPSIMAFRRRHVHRWAILATNLLLGATGVGWFVALMWALQAPDRSLL